MSGFLSPPTPSQYRERCLELWAEGGPKDHFVYPATAVGFALAAAVGEVAETSSRSWFDRAANQENLEEQKRAFAALVKVRYFLEVAAAFAAIPPQNYAPLGVRRMPLPTAVIALFASCGEIARDLDLFDSVDVPPLEEAHLQSAIEALGTLVAFLQRSIEDLEQPGVRFRGAELEVLFPVHPGGGG
jgi:hypothetical protein